MPVEKFQKPLITISKTYELPMLAAATKPETNHIKKQENYYGFKAAYTLTLGDDISDDEQTTLSDEESLQTHQPNVGKLEVHSYTDWSNLLEAAADQNISELRQLMAKASLQEAQEALSMLKHAMDKVIKYTSSVRYDIPLTLEPETLTDYETTIDMHTLLQTRQTILMHLTSTHYKEGIQLTNEDKRLIEAQLLDEVNNCKSISEVLTFLAANETILNHQPNPQLGWIKSKLFHTPTESTLKTNVTTALRSRAMILMPFSNEYLDESIHEGLIKLFAGNKKQSLEFQQYVDRSTRSINATL